jgi:predicted AlkP superfamily pyrophosphatase or phosphodiesterase
VLLFAIAALMVGTVGGAQSPARKLIIISWDGNADWVVDQLLSQGKLPNVARLARNGVRAEYLTQEFPAGRRAVA